MASIKINTNKVKDNEQRKALKSWVNSNYCGSIIAGTGFGKSRCGVVALVRSIEDIDGARGLVLVPTTQLKDQFADEFHKWGYTDMLDRVDILCYQSAYKLQDQHYRVVICDEIHLGLSPKYRKFFNNNTYDRLLCMTATLPEEPDYKVLLDTLAPTVYTITLDECVNLGLVAPYEIHCLPVPLTPDESAEYKKINNSFVYWKYQLGQFDAFSEAQRIIRDKNAAPADKQAAAQFYRAIRMRKGIVDHAQLKLSAAQYVVEETLLEDLNAKILIFSGSNGFTDLLAEATAPMSAVYHSGKTKKQKEAALDNFKNGDINVLCSTKALNQGFDVQNADYGIICGLTSKSLSMIQRVGRLLRFKDGKKSKIMIFYVPNSQEEKWLKSAVKSLNNVVWETINYE